MILQYSNLSLRFSLTAKRNKRNPNSETIKAYNKEYRQYLVQTPHIYLSTHTPLLRWIDYSLGLLPKDAAILEIGSGSGRDARYIRKKGYQVTCSDGAENFVRYLQSQGEPCLWIDVLSGELPRGYDLIFANAVMPHFTNQQLADILMKVWHTLESGGLFAFSIKEGKGESWVVEKFETKRYINYWEVKHLQSLLKSSGWEIAFLENGIKGDLPTHTWINVTVKKP